MSAVNVRANPAAARPERLPNSQNYSTVTPQPMICGPLNAAAIMRTAELVVPPQERRRPGRGWSGDARTEAELQGATDAMHTAWQRLRMDTRDAQLRRPVRKACNWLKIVRSAAVVRFFERHVVELEKQLRMGDQHGFFQNIKSVQLEETKKVESQCIRDEEGTVA